MTEIRRALPSDADEIGRVHVQSWRDTYRNHLPEDSLAKLDAKQRANRWSKILLDPDQDTFVAERDAAIVGFASLCHSRDPDADPGAGEIPAIYLLAEYWRRGIGSALLRELLLRAGQRNFRQLMLWVLESNARARSFYEASGFHFDGGRKEDRRSPEVVLREVRYRRDLRGRGA